MAKILFAGEQATGTGVEVKGFDSFSFNVDEEEGQDLYDALAGGGHEVTWMRTNRVAVHFPETLDALQAYDAVLLSDVGSNTLLFHPDMLANSNRHANRLKLLAEYVHQGGGLAMVGGWMSFAGFDGRARYHGSPLEEALPVTCLPYDDRQERPEGVTPTVAQGEHPILRDVPAEWPWFMGYNKVIPRVEATTILMFDADPLLSVWSYGKGRSAAFATDCAPHWAPPGFLSWPGYSTFWNNLLAWVCGAL